MKKLLTMITGFLLLCAIAIPAHALQTAYSYSGIDLYSFSYTDAYAARLGFVASEAYASSDSGFDFDYGTILNSWAEASVNGAWAEAGMTGSRLYSQAEAYAGGTYGTESTAFAASKAVALWFYVPVQTTISINYWLDGNVTGDPDLGYAGAGSGALLAVLGGGDDADWQYVTGGYGEDRYNLSGLLSLTLSQGFYTVFAGTAAFASAAEAAAPVPEPATMLLLGTGLLGLAGLGRKKLLK